MPNIRLQMKKVIIKHTKLLIKMRSYILPHPTIVYLREMFLFFFTTWIKKDDGLEGRILVVINLNILERLHQLVQHSVGYPADLRFRTVPVDHAAIACRHQASGSVGNVSGWEGCSAGIKE